MEQKETLEEEWAKKILDELSLLAVEEDKINTIAETLTEFAHEWCRENLDFCRELFERP